MDTFNELATKDQLIPYFFTLFDHKLVPAIYQRNRDNPGYAKLYLVNYHKISANISEAIATAETDLYLAKQIIQPITHLLPEIIPLKAALYKAGYNWPSYLSVEIKEPQSLNAIS